MLLVAPKRAVWCSRLVVYVAVAVASFLIPGVGHALAGSNRRGVIWFAAVLVTMALVTVTVWALLVSLGLRLACIVDAVLCGRQQRSPTSWVPSVALGIANIMFWMVLRVGVVEAFKVPASSMMPTLLVDDHFFVDKLSRRWRTPDRGEVIVFHQPCAGRDYVKRVVAVAGDTVEVRCNVVYINGKAIPNTLVAADCSYEEHYEDAYDGDEHHQRQCSRYRETLGAATYDVFHDWERPARDRDPLHAADDHDFPKLDDRGPPSCTDQIDSYETSAAVDQPIGTLVARTPPAGGFKACDPQRHFVVPADALFTLGDNRANSNDSRNWGVVPSTLVKGRVTGIWYSPGPDGQRWSRFGGVE